MTISIFLVFFFSECNNCKKTDKEKVNKKSKDRQSFEGLLSKEVGEGGNKSKEDQETRSISEHSIPQDLSLKRNNDTKRKSKPKGHKTITRKQSEGCCSERNKEERAQQECMRSSSEDATSTNGSDRQSCSIENGKEDMKAILKEENTRATGSSSEEESSLSILEDIDGSSLDESVIVEEETLKKDGIQLHKSEMKMSEQRSNRSSQMKVSKLMDLEAKISCSLLDNENEMEAVNQKDTDCFSVSEEWKKPKKILNQQETKNELERLYSYNESNSDISDLDEEKETKDHFRQGKNESKSRFGCPEDEGDLSDRGLEGGDKPEDRCSREAERMGDEAKIEDCRKYSRNSSNILVNEPGMLFNGVFGIIYDGGVEYDVPLSLL
ncbi:serine protease HtrA-like [Latimeria chalumnae]|uniref:serine protease HtrA-like n=1 Tax=Latimeria chalumnae TaxID=7897 RepID=UPI00313AFB53